MHKGVATVCRVVVVDRVGQPIVGCVEQAIGPRILPGCLFSSLIQFEIPAPEMAAANRVVCPITQL
ncbi:MAG: hypothetical protein DMF95_06005 [Acidobacteria bacterium]|nr:MAG: hypothetical protein DMF96_02760 [Acidobacteriota bacterium]PYR20871.1 MAG: hypothetical protein DMF94_10245 [Acidobacteriota bacterium]PYR52631.1 MAG: hypothetical protein DMF95_06005 [Acidobacteriota bacterium]